MWAAAGRGKGAPDESAYFAELSLMELLRTELDAPDLTELTLGDLLNVRLEPGLIPFPKDPAFDALRIASTDLPDDLTELSLRDLLNLNVTLRPLEEEATEIDFANYGTTEPGDSVTEKEGNPSSRPSQGGSFTFEELDLALLVDETPPEDEALFELDELEDQEHGSGLKNGNFARLTESDDLVPEAVTTKTPGSKAAGIGPEASSSTEWEEQAKVEEEPSEEVEGPSEEVEEPSEEVEEPSEEVEEPSEEVEEPSQGGTIMGTNGDDDLRGGPGDDSLHGKQGNDYLDGGAGADDLRGGQDDDVLLWDAADRVVDGGLGNDTLLVQSADLALGDVAARISNIEQIDLGSGSNDLVLSAQDVLDVSSGDMLTILGSSDDSVDIGSGWTDGGTVNGYHIYTQAVGPKLAVLHIEEAIDVLSS